MKLKLILAVSALIVLSGCTGTTYNNAKNCSEDYVIHPSISIPSMISACDSVNK
ncbi:DUF4223 domain-containing protein [Vibrio owensii]|uniref:DUF4223 family protein n=1 Tax=Vibrio owensii TaxID=696485 RepID=UPI0010529D23|nr:DUF4223 domain-containing protein [Vibrio owensii]